MLPPGPCLTGSTSLFLSAAPRGHDHESGRQVWIRGIYIELQGYLLWNDLRIISNFSYTLLALMDQLLRGRPPVSAGWGIWTSSEGSLSSFSLSCDPRVTVAALTCCTGASGVADWSFGANFMLKLIILSTWPRAEQIYTWSSCFWPDYFQEVPQRVPWADSGRVPEEGNWSCRVFWFLK